MSTETEQSTQLHGGRLVAQRLKAHGVTKLFTLSGGHLFSIFDGCREEGIDLVDVRHESAAAFAAEGWAKVTRQPGVAALTAGPGVTNGMSAMASAQQNGSPMLVLGGRAPAMRWGQGSLQELDHVPFVRPLTKLATTAEATVEIPGLIDEALTAAVSAHSGPTFIDFPMDVVFMEAPAPEAPAPLPDPAGGPVPDVARAATLLREAERPVIMAGTNLYWGHGEQALLELAQELGIPVFLNGLARGCVPADHELFFARARSNGLKGADVALVIGVPMDFRLGFGQSFGEETELVVIDRAEPLRDHPRPVAAELYGSVPGILDALRSEAGGGADTGAWVSTLRAAEDEKRAAERVEFDDDRAPLHPMRLYRELGEVIDRDAIVIGDGGDFVSYAGRVMNTYQPGCWLDPGPFGCLGCGPGYALAAKVAHPDRQVVLLLGDGAFGFSGMEFDTFARHGVNVVGVMGNNGIWALEKHPMEFLYGYSVAADLRPGTRYDQVVAALGGHGELVERPADLKPALERAFSAGLPALVNVLTDPDVVYPRKSNLAWADLADAALAARVLAVQHAAYAIEAELIGYPRLPPLHETLEGLQATPEELWLCEEGGELCGVVGLEQHADELVIARLFVAPPEFRRGIGAALVAQALARADGRRVRVGTGARNLPALALYERFGFRRLDEGQPTPGVGYVELVRDP